MPTILPTDWRLSAASTHAGEFQTLELLAERLPDELTVFHSLHWTNAAKHYTQWGEIDFCILHPSGRILVIEQKNGGLEETPEGLVKHYGSTAKNVARQIGRSVEQLREKFKRVHHGKPLEVDYLIYCPDYRLQSLNAVSLDKTRIVDASRREQLPEIVVEMLSGKPADPVAHKRIFEFFCDDLRLEPDVNAHLEKQARHYVQLADGLADTLAQLHFAPYRLCVRGTAGSGKTQAALKEFRHAAAAGDAVLLTCFNRPLADRITALLAPLPQNASVATFYQLCRDIALAQGILPTDFAPQSADWDALAEAVLNHEIPEAFRFKAVIVDEGQDFSPRWVELIDRLLLPDARLLWLEDPRQNLYGKPAADFATRHSHGVTLHASQNFRNPRSVVTALHTFLDIPTAEIRASNPIPGLEVDIHTYQDGSELAALIEKCLSNLQKSGFAPEQIALISFHGFKHSRMLQWRNLAGFSLKRFTGEYDEKGQQVVEEGEVLVDSIYRFKGQHAPAVIFTEIDFTALSETIKNRLFCGMTRASMKLDLILSEPAAAALLQVD
ncbi:MAG: ATP-binding domain-containing protein [Zoogloeaceae bacterium]|jgi:phosphoglycolate phosphatase-like HAD superfamily hydrolase|nr:ATP-binding domain-containing protein [Zoogloeaceae bacterium]